ncbi:hypothetical protein SUGI_1077960 [Cryptomeria japonica]|nr:hypothetical protein SUGI_1077960 [Cryptomeria japonica]
MFKEPFPKHDKGKAKATDDQTNYTKASYNYDSTINHISMDNYVSTIIIKDKTPENPTQRPKIVLKGVGSSFEPTSECHVTTRRGKITLQGASTKNTASSSTKHEYDLVEQLGKTPALISILELLRIFPAHKAILDKILRDTTIPTNLNVDQFQAMVGYLSIPHSLTFIEVDDASVSQPHNAPLHVEAFIHKHRIKRVLIDGGAGLNICTLSTIKQLGYSDKAVNSTNQITIKAYDDEEHSSKGTVTLPLRVGLVIKDVVCQVLDLDLTYNILLGRPWIHEMRAVPSTYHQCIKFPHNGVEVTVNGDPNPFIYCNNLRSQTETMIPSNREAVPSSAYIDPESLKPLTSKQGEFKGKFQDKGMGEYTLNQTMYLRQVMSSPKEYGRPHPNKQVSIMVLKWDPTTFQRCGELEEEDLYKMLYQNIEDDTQDHINIPCEKYGKGFKILQKFGYDGKSPLALRKEGIIEPLQPELTFKKERSKGLGFLTSKVHTKRIEETIQIKVAKIQQEDRYSTDSNEWEWGLDKSSSDYEFTETFREPNEPTKEEKFYKKFRVGQGTTHEDST